MKKNLSILLLILFTLIVSCQNNTDYSKTLEEYYEVGVPNINSEWTDTELTLTIESLKSLKKIDSFPLPKFESNKSSLLIEKIISELPSINVNNTANYTSESSKYSFIKESSINLLFLYGVSDKEIKYYSKESIEIQKHLIEESTKLHLLTIDYAQNKSSELIISGKEQIQSGLIDMIGAALDANNSNQKYHKDDKIQLAITVSKSLKVCWNSLDKENKIKLKKRINKIVLNSEYIELRTIFSDLLQEITS